MTQTLAFIGAIVICFIGGYLRGRDVERAKGKRTKHDLKVSQITIGMIADENIALRAERDALAKQVKIPIKKVEVDT